MKYSLHTLKNGLRVVLAPMKGTETATMIVMSGTGSRYETPEQNGLAHFLEHMFFKGTNKRTSAKVIAEELDGIGSVSNAFTSEERTAYYAKVDADYLNTALDVVSDIFLNSTLPAKEIEKERGAIIQEIDMYEDMPMRTVHDVFKALIYGADHPLGRTILGPKKNIRAFSREDFKKYHRSNYTPGNTVVCIAGSFDAKKVLAKITRDYGKLKAAPAPEYVPFVDSQDTPRVAIKEKKTDQTQLIVGTPSYPLLHKDEYALDVLATILGSGMSSRLFLEVREKRGLAYSVHAWTEAYPDTGSFSVQAGVEHAKLEEALKTILAEFKKTTQRLVSAEELKKAKAYIEGTTTLRMETSDAIAEHAATSLVTVGRIRDLDEIIKGVKKVTAEDVRRVARDILKTEKLNLAIIGPHVDAEKLKVLLKI